MIAAANNGEQGEPDDESGGRGHSVNRDPHRIRGNIALIRRAIRDDYPIDADTRASLIREMREIMETNEDERARIGAAATILAADNINAKREAMDQKDEHVLMPKTFVHRGEVSVNTLTNDQLDRIIAGDFTPIEDASGGGAQGAPTGNGEST